jgi:hypothetical protein
MRRGQVLRLGMAGKKKSLESDCMIKHLCDIGVKFS